MLCEIAEVEVIFWSSWLWVILKAEVLLKMKPKLFTDSFLHSMVWSVSGELVDIMESDSFWGDFCSMGSPGLFSTSFVDSYLNNKKFEHGTETAELASWQRPQQWVGYTSSFLTALWLVFELAPTLSCNLPETFYYNL